MPASRLSALDASFLEVESPSAHMHVGWAALLAPPEHGSAPSFEELAAHITGRLGRAPRYRQRLVETPLDVHDPVWVDDADFEPSRHILRASSPDLGEVVDTIMSVPLERDRPLWELWIADRLADGRIGLVGKAHHCMVDGLAAVELSTLLLDPTPQTPDGEDGQWRPEPRPGSLALLAEGFESRLREQLAVLRFPIELVLSPRRILGLPAVMRHATRTLAHAVSPAPASSLNPPSSPLRHLAAVSRPLEDLRRVKQTFGTTVNDVLLAVSAGALRRFMADHGERPKRLKAMVPVSVRTDDADAELGNRISFMFLFLPCDEPDPLRRLREVNDATSARKAAGEPEDSDAALQALGHAPRLVKRAAAHLAASPQMFNVVVSNIPGPREPLFLRGCRLLEAYPIVPLADRHALSIGMTSVADNACFGLYADRKALPDVDRLAGYIDDAIEELLGLPEGRPAYAGSPRSSM